MYEKLIADLRYCADKSESCALCSHCKDGLFKDGLLCIDDMLMQAADAIERLERRENDLEKLCAAWQKRYDGERRWIPVTERFPEMGKEVLVSDKQKNVTIAWIVGCFSKDGASFEWACSDGWIDDQLPITHWMPLPTPPKGE